MDRVHFKRLAKEDLRANYVPWLLVSILAIVISFYTAKDQWAAGSEINITTRLSIQIRWLNVIELILSVPLARLAIHLAKGVYQDASESLFHNEQWLRDIGAMLVVGLYTFLWTLLLIVPGIIKGYSYSMVPYILAEDDTISISEAIAKSQQITYGYKWDLFLLDLSFILWDFAAALTLGLLSFYVIPYQKATWAEYYLELSNDEPAGSFY